MTGNSHHSSPKAQAPFRIISPGKGQACLAAPAGHSFPFTFASVECHRSAQPPAGVQIRALNREHEAQRVHVGIWDILGPSSRYMGTPLGPKYIP